MLYKIAFRDMKRSKGMYGIIIVLLVVTFLVSITMVSAVEVKFRKYSAFSEYLGSDGIFVKSLRLCYTWDEIYGWAYVAEDEIKEVFPAVRDVLAVEVIEKSSVAELDEPVTVWAYSSAVTDSLSVKMEDGRWFEKSDMEDETLKVVVTYNEGVVNVGDVLTLQSEFCESTYPVEVIGVIGNRESLYYTDVFNKNFTDDYRDLYYTYDYEMEEGNIIMILADEQILNGKDRGLYEEINHTLGETRGYAKLMRGGTLITFKEGTSQEERTQCIEELKKSAGTNINGICELSKMNEKSLQYITEELRTYLPVFVCVIGFLIIAAVSANVITTKKQLKSYAIYYTCGLPWKKCARISLRIAILTVIIAIALILISVLGLSISGGMADNGIQLGAWQLLTIFVIGVVYVILAWAIPLSIVRKASAKEIMTNNK